MTTRACFALVTGSFLSLLTAGAIRPAAADPYSSPAAGPEYAAVPPSRDDASGLELLWVERLAEDGGSGAMTVEVAPTEDGIDPWADAFAESSRLRATVAAGPSFPVIINGQVQGFIERFTGSRRDVVGLWLNRSGR